MPTEMTIKDKQYLAKILYTREQLDAKIVSKRVGISEQTMSKWVNAFNWKSLRNRLLVSKELVLDNLYQQMEEMNNAIHKREEGQRFANTKEADVLVKYTASIRNLETDLAIADLVESGIRFIKHLQRVAPIEQVRDVAELWNTFIQASIKK